MEAKNRENKMKYCAYCGHTLPVNAIRCPDCGNEVVLSFGEKCKRFLKKHAVHIAAPLIALAVLAGGIGIGYCIGHDQSKNSQTIQTSSQTKSSLYTSTSDTDEKIVYITPYGKKYHRATCRHVEGKAIKKKLSEVEKTHEPCAVCKP